VQEEIGYAEIDLSDIYDRLNKLEERIGYAEIDLTAVWIAVAIALVLSIVVLVWTVVLRR